MKVKITVYTLASDDDRGTMGQVFATEEEAVDALLEAINWTKMNEEEYSRGELKS
jgi:hypothetical protein